jgi:hypothetical protein
LKTKDIKQYKELKIMCVLMKLRSENCEDFLDRKVNLKYKNRDKNTKPNEWSIQQC